MEKTFNSSDDSNKITKKIDNSDLASRWDRLWASLIDVLTIIPITIPLMYFTGGFEGISEGVQPSLSYALTMALISTLIFLAIHGKFIVQDGQTLGKKVLNIKIVTVSGQHASIPFLAKRYGFFWVIPQIPAIGPLINIVNILFIFGKSKRCLHDYVGGTKVIIANKQSKPDA